MMFTPWGPRAVSTGGAGVAAPAGIWILTIAAMRRLAMRFLLPGGPGGAGGASHPVWLELCDLGELELDRRLPAEDVDENLQAHLVLVDLGDRAGDVGERPFPHPDALADLVQGPVASLLGRAVGAGGLDLEDALHLFTGQ